MTNLLWNPRLFLALQETGAAPEGEPAGGGGLMDLMFPMLMIVGIFYVVLIMPERKKQKKRDAMLGAMSKGDEVMTTSGMYGTIAQIQDDVITLKVANDVRLRFNRAAIQNIVGNDKEEPEKS